MVFFFFFKNYLPDEMLKFSSLESVGMIRGPWIVEAKSSSRILPSSEWKSAGVTWQCFCVADKHLILGKIEIQLCSTLITHLH